MKLRAIGNAVLFQFVEKIKNGQIVDETKSGIILNANVTEQHKPRWGRVLSVGPDVKEELFEYILIEPLKWTNSITFEGESFWQTDDEKILLTATSPTASF